MTGGVGGAVVWLTGPPSSGKSTLARRLAGALADAGCAHCVLDGDEVRAALVPPPGYDEGARAGFYATLARLAALLAGQGLVVLVPATAHRRAFRDEARALAPRFVEVFVDTPLETCKERDAKGLYKAGVADLPGAGLDYEVPEAPEVVATAGEGDDAVRRVLAALDMGPRDR
jgi:adenylylsulfate kinase